MDKYCKPCDRNLPLSSFGKNRAQKDGLQNNCKECRSLRAKTKDAQRIAEYQSRYRQENSASLSASASARYAANPEPKKEQAAQWRRKNPERKKQNDALWRERNRDRSNASQRLRVLRYRSHKRRVQHVKYTQSQLDHKFEYWRGKCHICNIKIQGKFHWDHVKPISRGGPDMLSNLRPAHPHCNVKKSNLWPVSFDNSESPVIYGKMYS